TTVTCVATNKSGMVTTHAFTITVTTTPPVADPQSVVTDEGVPVAIALIGSDPDSDPLTYSIVKQPKNGTLSGAAPNVVYTPAAGFFGADSFSFQVSDGVATSKADVTITVGRLMRYSTDITVDLGTLTVGGS